LASSNANSIYIDDKDVIKLLQTLSDFSEVGAKVPMTKAANAIKERLVANIKGGKGFSEGAYPNIQEVTNEFEIAHSGPFTDTRKRFDVSSNQVPFNVTGDTAKSLSVQVKSNQEVNVGYDSARTDMVLQGNARASGNVNKARRDPVGVTEGIPSDYEFDVVTDAVEKALDRLLNGF
jgi:hypothetical protein